MIIALQILMCFLIFVETVFSALVIVLIGMNIPPYYRSMKAKRAEKATEIAKERLRQEKEQAAANEGFFGEAYVCGFDKTGELLYRGHRVSTGAGMTNAFKDIDQIADTQVFKNTEVI